MWILGTNLEKIKLLFFKKSDFATNYTTSEGKMLEPSILWLCDRPLKTIKIIFLAVGFPAKSLRGNSLRSYTLQVWTHATNWAIYMFSYLFSFCMSIIHRLVLPNLYLGRHLRNTSMLRYQQFRAAQQLTKTATCYPPKRESSIFQE